MPSGSITKTTLLCKTLEDSMRTEARRHPSGKGALLRKKSQKCSIANCRHPTQIGWTQAQEDLVPGKEDLRDVPAPPPRKMPKGNVKRGVVSLAISRGTSPRTVPIRKRLKFLKGAKLNWKAAKAKLKVPMSRSS